MTVICALGLAGVLAQAVPTTAGAVVSGQVLDQGTNAPVSGAQVVLISMPTAPPTGPMTFRPQTATTDENGRFVFTDVAPGRYRITAQKAGFALAADSRSMPPALEMRAGDRLNDVTVRVTRGGVIAGRVVDQYGEPIVDARVTALRKLSPPPTSPPSAAAAVARARFPNGLVPAGPSAQTNDLGEFRVHSLPPGEYYVQAAPPFSFGGAASGQGAQGAGTTLVPTYFPGTSDSGAAQSLVVTSGQTTDGVMVRMLVAPAFQVSGIVVDEAGAPVQNAMVRLSSQDGSMPRPPMIGGINQARTDASGSFSLANVTSGAYTLIAMPPVVVGTLPRGASGVSTFSSGWAVAPGGAVMTESRDGAMVQFRDDQGTRVAVAVSDSSVTGLQVVIRRR